MPSTIDADGNGLSAYVSPDTITIPSNLIGLTTQALTNGSVAMFKANSPTANPSASSVTSVVYSPAQIRAAYAMPASNSTSAANLGAGQTIYIIDAYDHPNAVSDLNYFSQTFGLPTCTVAAVTSAAPLPAPRNNACTVSVVFANSSGALTNKRPAYNTGWAQEISLDLQWAHAIAPLARIVLIEAQSASIVDLSGAIALANTFGNGAVSMSFSAAEGSYVAAPAYSTGLFSQPNISYYAATGDAGSGVNWPAVESTVVGVGGTHLQFNGVSKTESAWSGSGGGISSFLSLPTYQASLTIKGEPASGQKFRAVSDVAMDADPYSGVYVVFTPSGGRSAWYAFGGTSLATPMWAALMTVANANRAIFGYPTLSAPHAKLYSATASNYTSLFYDVTSGSDGSCLSCFAGPSYDSPTGLGSPNATNLVTYLSSVL